MRAEHCMLKISDYVSFLMDPFIVVLYDSIQLLVCLGVNQFPLIVKILIGFLFYFILTIKSQRNISNGIRSRTTRFLVTLLTGISPFRLPEMGNLEWLVGT